MGSEDGGIGGIVGGSPPVGESQAESVARRDSIVQAGQPVVRRPAVGLRSAILAGRVGGDEIENLSHQRIAAGERADGCRANTCDGGTVDGGLVVEKEIQLVFDQWAAESGSQLIEPGGGGRIAATVGEVLCGNSSGGPEPVRRAVQGPSAGRRGKGGLRATAAINGAAGDGRFPHLIDRKSTRLNSS